MVRTSLTALALLGSLATASADTWHFQDVLRPHGYERSMAEKTVAFKACGAGGETFSDKIKNRFVSCMRKRGWVVDSITPDPSDYETPDRDDATTVHFDDTTKPKGRERGDRALQASTRRCGQHGRRDYESSAFLNCMATAGWRHTYTNHPSRSSSDSSYDPSFGTPIEAPVIPESPAPSPPPTMYDSNTGQPIP